MWSVKQASDFTIHVKCQMRNCRWHFPTMCKEPTQERTRLACQRQRKARPERWRKACWRNTCWSLGQVCPKFPLPWTSQLCVEVGGPGFICCVHAHQGSSFLLSALQSLTYNFHLPVAAEIFRWGKDSTIFCHCHLSLISRRYCVPCQLSLILKLTVRSSVCSAYFTYIHNPLSPRRLEECDT